jgi:hypothetical protein
VQFTLVLFISNTEERIRKDGRTRQSVPGRRLDKQWRLLLRQKKNQDSNDDHQRKGELSISVFF